MQMHNPQHNKSTQETTRRSARKHRRTQSDTTHLHVHEPREVPRLTESRRTRLLSDIAELRGFYRSSGSIQLAAPFADAIQDAVAQKQKFSMRFRNGCDWQRMSAVLSAFNFTNQEKLALLSDLDQIVVDNLKEKVSQISDYSQYMYHMDTITTQPHLQLTDTTELKIRLMLDYDDILSTYTSRIQFQREMKKELCGMLGVESDCIQIQGLARGSIIVAVAVIGTLALLGGVAAGARFAYKRIFPRTYQNRKDARLKAKQAELEGVSTTKPIDDEPPTVRKMFNCPNSSQRGNRFEKKTSLNDFMRPQHIPTAVDTSSKDVVVPSPPSAPYIGSPPPSAPSSEVEMEKYAVSFSLDGTQNGPVVDVIYQEDLCIQCEMEPITAAFLHGDSVHAVCCKKCADAIFEISPDCPMCRLPIDRVIKHFGR